MSSDASPYLTHFQTLLALPRETLPQSTAAEARKALRGSAESLGLEYAEIEGVAPTYLLLPAGGGTPLVLFFATWHAEVLPVFPAAVEGAERLALAVTLAGIGGGPGERPGAAVVIAPSASAGSVVLGQVLRKHRERLGAPIAFWPRVAPAAPRRRRIFLGARGRVVLGIWGDSANAYSIRDGIVKELRDEAYGPRPLDFELLRKIAQSLEAMDFLDETLDDPAAISGKGEERLRQSLFEPRGHVVLPQVKHPDRPRAWLIFETAENMDAEDLLERVRARAEGARVELAEAFPWERISIHHASIQAQIKLSKMVSEGPEIWPSAPWMTPSGVFSRALGTQLAEWSIPIQASTAIRFPSLEEFARLSTEVSGLIGRALEEVSEATK